MPDRRKRQDQSEPAPQHEHSSADEQARQAEPHVNKRTDAASEERSRIYPHGSRSLSTPPGEPYNDTRLRRKKP